MPALRNLSFQAENCFFFPCFASVDVYTLTRLALHMSHQEFWSGWFYRGTLLLFAKHHHVQFVWMRSFSQSSICRHAYNSVSRQIHEELTDMQRMDLPEWQWTARFVSSVWASRPFHCSSCCSKAARISALSLAQPLAFGENWQMLGRILIWWPPLSLPTTAGGTLSSADW